MKRLIAYGSLVAAISLCFLVAPALADSLQLKSGQTVNGKYLGGTDSRIDFLVNGRVQSYTVTDVQSISFSGSPYGQTAAPSSASTPAVAPAPAPAPSTASGTTSLTIPVGTTLMVRMIDSVDSSVNKVGDTFNASLDSALVVGNTVVAPKGADVYGRLAEAKEAGRLSGQSELRLELTGIMINGQVVPIVTGAYGVTGSSRGKSTAQKAGIGAAVGGIIGAIAGGGKGAAIGAGVGAGAGTAAQVLTHGQQVRVPSETLLDFTIAQPVSVTIPAA
jgi:hypothetical protein